jgi:hypothetical protein
MQNVAVFLRNRGYTGEKYFAKNWIIWKLSANTDDLIMKSHAFCFIEGELFYIATNYLQLLVMCVHVCGCGKEFIAV